MVRGHGNFQIRSLLRIVHFSGGVGLKMKNFKNSKNRYFQNYVFQQDPEIPELGLFEAVRQKYEIRGAFSECLRLEVGKRPEKTIV